GALSASRRGQHHGHRERAGGPHGSSLPCGRFPWPHRDGRPPARAYSTGMGADLSTWPPVPTLARLALALAIGLFVGIERERRQKVAGVRTFAFAAVLGAAGGLLGERFGLLSIGLLGVLVVLLNLDTLKSGEGAEITTSAALLVTGFAGLLAGQGHTFTPTVVGVITAALLAW